MERIHPPRKHKLKIKYYLRYADDFLVLNASTNTKWKEIYLESIKEFLKNVLKLDLHQKKIVTRKFKWGIDFCGYIVLPHYILPRTKTKRRILKKVMLGSDYQALQSYLGYLSHSNSHKLSNELKNLYWF